MILWRVFQLLVTFAGGSFIIWVMQPEKANPIIVVGFGIMCAYGVTHATFKLIDLYRWLRRPAS